VHFRTSDIKGVDQGLRVARWEVGHLEEIGLQQTRCHAPQAYVRPFSIMSSEIIDKAIPFGKADV
jgi:hypothetical protein